MENRSNDKKLIALFILITYGISAIADYIWISSKSALHPAAFLTILAPTIGAIAVYYKSRRKVKVNLSKCSIKEIICCVSIPIIYFAISFIIYSIFTGSMKEFEFNCGDILRIIILYIFMGILEEVGWRGVLLPLMQRVFDYKKAIVLNGLVWALWHYPMILSGLILPYVNSLQGIFIFTIEVILMTTIIGNLQKKLKMISIWPIIFLHAAHNILSEIIINNVGTKSAVFIGDAGYIVVLFIAIFAILLAAYKRR